MIRSTHRYLAAWLAVSLLAGCAQQQTPPSASAARQAPSSTQQVALTIAAFIEKHHLSPPGSDAALGRAMADSTLRRLDPARQYLLQAEVDQALANSSNWPGKFRNGDIAEPLGLHQLVQRRMAEQRSYELQVLMATAALPTGSGQRSVSDAGWAGDRRQLEARWQTELAKKLARTSALFADEEQTRAAWVSSYTKLGESVRQLSLAELEAQTIDGLMQGYDKASRYTPGGDLELRSGDLNLVGIGLVLKSQGADIEVVRVVPGGPADQAGKMHPGERILAVGNGADQLLPVLGWPLAEVVRLLRGAPSTQIFLAIGGRGDDASDVRVASLVRSTVRLEDQRVKGRVLTAVVAGQPSEVGVISVPSFYINNQAARSGRPDYLSATADVERALADLKSRRVTTVVLDLRGSGGSVKEAGDMSALFLPVGQTGITFVARGGSSHQLVPDERQYKHSGPVVVLVDARTAGPAELFAASLRDHGVAVLLGQRTHGLGTVQHHWDLREAGLIGAGTATVTRARSYRPNGQGIQQVGVTPDLLMPEPAFTIREGDEGNSLPPHDMQLVSLPKKGSADDSLAALRQWHQDESNSPRWKASFATDASTAQNVDDFWLDYAVAAAAEYARIVQGSSR